jgi:PAS domain-containing protein
VATTEHEQADCEIAEPSPEGRTQIISDTVDRLQTSERSFRTLVESVIDYAIFMLDSEGHVANWNPGAERIKGYSRTEINVAALLLASFAAAIARVTLLGGAVLRGADNHRVKTSKLPMMTVSRLLKS